jgi:pimeloyl-ACP methyl ester carboxylesterase
MACKILEWGLEYDHKISQPTLIITGTEDVAVPSSNSLIRVDKIPGAYLVQIPEAGH